MSNPPVVRLDNVTKFYGQHLALDQASLEVPSGVVFALLGENGAGKTTMIRILLGLERPDSGSSSVLGLNSQTDSLAIRKQVGFVAEQPTMYDWMTVERIGWFAAGFYDDQFLKRYNDRIQAYRLPAKTKLKSLSKGMRAKVALALATSHDPSLLILDEPTSGLDTLVRREFLESMVDLTADNRTVFLSSHQINEVERVADIVAIVRGGKILLVEDLDLLKKTSVELIVTLNDSNAPFEVAGAVVAQRRRGRQCDLVMRGEAESLATDLRQHPQVSALEVRSPSLEEIFVAYMQSNDLAAQSEGWRSAGSDAEVKSL